MSQLSMIQIINAALLAEGQEVVYENDGSDEWRVLSSNWPLIVEAALEDGNFHFTMDEQMLQTRTSGLFGFDDAYLIPYGALHVRNVWEIRGEDRFEIPWVQSATHVHVNCPSGVMIQFAKATTSDIWSPTFTRAIQMFLEALILRSLKEEKSEARAREADAWDMLSTARTRSASKKTPGPPVKGEGKLARRRFRRG